MNEMQISDLQANFSYCLLRYIFAMRRKLLDRSDYKSSLVYVMARSHEAASHHLSQYRPKSISTFGRFRPQSVKYWTAHGYPSGFLHRHCAVIPKLLCSNESTFNNMNAYSIWIYGSWQCKLKSQQNRMHIPWGILYTFSVARTAFLRLVFLC